jgi:hypothetical protein
MSSDFNRVNVEDQTTDKNAYEMFKQSMINRLCEKYRHRLRNVSNPNYEFNIVDIPNSKNRADENGFGITSIADSVLNERLGKFEEETHYIKVLWDKGKFLLTKDGMYYCKSLDRSHT